MYKLYLTCPRGLEEVLCNETKEYLPQKINIDNGGITFNGNLEDIYRINWVGSLWLRQSTNRIDVRSN